MIRRGMAVKDRSSRTGFGVAGFGGFCMAGRREVWQGGVRRLRRLRRGVSLTDAVSMAVRARRGKQGFGELRSVRPVKERRLRCHTSMTAT